MGAVFPHIPGRTSPRFAVTVSTGGLPFLAARETAKRLPPPVTTSGAQNEVALPCAIRHHYLKTADSRGLDLLQQALMAFLGAAADVRQNRP